MGRDCERIRDDLWLLDSGELPPGRAAEVRAHLDACEACEALRAERAAALVRYDSAAADDLDDVAFRRMVGRARGAAADAFPTAPSRARRISPLAGGILGAAAAVAVLLGGIAIGRSAGPSAGDLARLESRVEDLRSGLVLASLGHSSPSYRLEGLALVAEIDAPAPRVAEAMLATLERDPSPNVRLAAVDALYRIPDLGAAAERLVAALERDPSPAVRVALIDLLVTREVADALDALRRLEREAEEAPVRERAAWAIRSLS